MKRIMKWTALGLACLIFAEQPIVALAEMGTEISLETIQPMGDDEFQDVSDSLSMNSMEDDGQESNFKEDGLEEYIPPEETTGGFSPDMMMDTSSEFLYGGCDDTTSVGSMENQLTETNKVQVDSSDICAAAKYKEWDYSFLKDYQYTGDYQSKYRTFDTVEEMQKCNSMKMEAGTVVITLGYYEKEDGGGATYVLTKDAAVTEKNAYVALENGLYAMLLPNTKVINGETCAIMNIKQYGAREGEDFDCSTAINAACTGANKVVGNGIYIDGNENGTPDIAVDRAILYIPEGEYKITDYIRAYNQNVSMVGEADASIIYTDNDYRKNKGYSEFLFEVQGGKNAYFANFVIEAREVDLYHYMRQFVLFYSDNVYVDNVDLLIPQTTYSCYYFEDKQYSNFCCYSGNKNITVDGCKMVQMSGTYRGANVGVLDLYSSGEENITIMNCDLYGNARDEQIGVFGTAASSSHVKHVSFINNTVHFYEPKYVETIGNATMRVTIGYSDSNDVDDVLFAGNHFIAECDSKFITFGKCTNVVLEKNIFEIVCTYSTWSMVFDSCNEDEKNIEVRNNEFYLTSYEGKGKGNFIGGNLSFHHNKVVCDVPLNFGMRGKNFDNNEFDFIYLLGSNVANGSFSADCNLRNNRITTYNGYGDVLLSYNGMDANESAEVTGNTFINYARAKRNSKGNYEKASVWEALIKVASNMDTLSFTDNTYKAPNYFYNARLSGKTADELKSMTEQEKREYTYNKIFYYRVGIESEGKVHVNNIIAKNNLLQGACGCVSYPQDNITVMDIDDNTFQDPDYDVMNEDLCDSIDITKDGQVVKELDITEDSITLDYDVYLKTNFSYGDDGTAHYDVVKAGAHTKDVDWISSVASIAGVVKNADGTVTLTRKLYGDVKLLCVPKDGSGVWGTLVVHFVKAKTDRIETPKTEITLQPGLKHYTDFTVYPKTASQTLIWESSNEEVAVVNGRGRITAKAVGECDITARTADGTDKSIRMHVTVSELTVKKINLDQWYKVYDASQIGETLQVGVSGYVPANAVNTGISRWESSDASVCSVNQKGLVTVKGAGTCRIKAYSMDESVYGFCTIYVKPGKVDLSETHTDSTVTLSYKGTDKCYGYHIYKYNESAKSWELLRETKEKSFTVNGLKANAAYKFKVCEYITGYETGERVCYEGEGATIEAATCKYIPVNTFKLYGNMTNIAIAEGETKECSVEFNKSANYPELSFDIKIKDESIARLESTQVNDGRIGIKIKGIKCGITELEISAKDENNKNICIPMGVCDSTKLGKDNQLNIKNGYGYALISFSGIEDESKIDGYAILSLQGYSNVKVMYVAKNQESKYQVKITDDDMIAAGRSGFKEEESYRFKVVICNTDGTNYYFNGNYLTDDATVTCTMPAMTEVSQVSFAEKVYQVAVGENISIAADVLPENASVKRVSYSLVNPALAEISIAPEDEEKTGAVITGMQAGVTTLRADAMDYSDKRGEVKLVVLPAKVDGLIGSGSTSRIDLYWNRQEGVDGYALYRKTDSSDYVKIADIPSGSTETIYTDMDVTEKKAYTYRVEAYFTEGGTDYKGESSDELTVVAESEPFDSTILLEGYQGEYDGEIHEAVILHGLKDGIDTAFYSTDGETWTEKMPTVRNVSDSKTVYVRINRKGIDEPLLRSVLSIVQKRQLDSSQFSLKQSQYAYTEEKITPIVLSGIYVIGDDYETSYPDAEKTGAGKRQVLICGVGNYKGNISLFYEVANPWEPVKEEEKKEEEEKTEQEKEPTEETGSLEIGKIYESKNLRYQIVDESSVKVLGMVNKRKTSVTIPSTVKLNQISYQVTAIGSSAFSGCNKLKKVTVGKNVKTIGAKAFQGCTSLKKVSFKGSAVTSMGKSCFKNCKNLKSINLEKQKKLKKISNSSFYGCKKLTKITIPTAVTTIEAKSFYGCTKLKKVTVKTKKLKKVGSKAFKKCAKGIRFILPKSKKNKYIRLLKGKY